MSDSKKSADGLRIVGASAGSGKTYRLTEEVIHAVSPESSEPIPVPNLMAVTYTRKAAAELTARIRQKLVSTGATDSALLLPLAYVGTVHSVCLRLVKELAIEAGLPPGVPAAT